MSLKLISGCLLVWILGSLADGPSKDSGEEKTIPLSLLLRQLSPATGNEEDRVQVGPNEHVVIYNEEMYIQPPNAGADYNHIIFPQSSVGGNPSKGYWYFHTPQEYNGHVPALTYPVYNLNGIPQDYASDNQGLYHGVLPKNEETQKMQKKLVRHKRWGNSPCYGGQCGGGGFPSSYASSSASSSASSVSSSLGGGNLVQPGCFGGNCGTFGGGCRYGGCGGGNLGGGCRYGGCGSGNFGGGCPYGGCGSNFNCGVTGCWRKRK